MLCHLYLLHNPSSNIDLSAVGSDMEFISERLQTIEKQLEELSVNLIKLQTFSMQTQQNLDTMKNEVVAQVEAQVATQVEAQVATQVEAQVCSTSCSTS